MLYTSTDPAGAPIAVSGVSVAPDAAAPAGGWPVVAWAHGLAIASWSQYYPDADPTAIVHPSARPFVDDIGKKCITTTAGG